MPCVSALTPGLTRGQCRDTRSGLWSGADFLTWTPHVAGASRSGLRVQSRGTLLHDAAHLQWQKRRPLAAWPLLAALGERRHPLVTQVSKRSLSALLANQLSQVPLSFAQILQAVLEVGAPDVLHYGTAAVRLKALVT